MKTRILIEVFILLLAVSIFGYMHTHLILAYILIVVSLEFLFSIKVDSDSNVKVKSCPCCHHYIKENDLWKYSINKIVQNKNYYYCKNCNKIIANLEYYGKKMFVVTIFALGMIEIFLITFEYYFFALLMVLIWGIVYIYSLTNVETLCYEDVDKISENDPVYKEWKNEKSLKALLGILWFLMLMFSLALKYVIL